MNIKNLIKGEILQNDLLNYYNASIIYEELPYRVNGFVFNYDGVNFIIINNNISFYKKKKTFLHELAHIELNQLNQADSDLFAFNKDKYEDEVNEYINILLKEGL